MPIFTIAKNGSLQAIARNLCLRIVLQNKITLFDHIAILEQKMMTPMCLCTGLNNILIP